MMEWIGATILLLGALIGAFQVWMLLKAKKMVGQPVPDLDSLEAAVHISKGLTLLYFHSPNCAPCRRMSPIVDALAAERYAVVSVDISQNPEVARNFNVRATPTTILVEQGRIKRVQLGFLPGEKLQEMLG
ncbi:MAG: thioredoxin family protein [Gammaproteobacteria bacterium]|nr:thioredoxin family protein [Gammaproteobacteria bacterium]MCB1871471.1 thioredoxin family protein [Gammaproteobacteria bacterium]MCB1879617.1 thioredoxin family protein [Gammaproteobacteria bacterium]